MPITSDDLDVQRLAVEVLATALRDARLTPGNTRWQIHQRARRITAIAWLTSPKHEADLDLWCDLAGTRVDAVRAALHRPQRRGKGRPSQRHAAHSYAA